MSLCQGQIETHFMEKSLILNKDRFSVSLHLDSCAECYHLCNLGLRTWLYYCVLQTAKCGKLLDLHRSAIHLSNSTIKGSSYNESWGIPLVGGGFSWCPSTSDQNRTLEINFGKRLDLLWVRATSLWKASNFKGRSLLPIHTLLKGDGRCKIEDVSYFNLQPTFVDVGLYDRSAHSGILAAVPYTFLSEIKAILQP